MKPYFQDDAVTIWHGDCREILPLLDPVDLVLTDPPYGIGLDTDYTWRTAIDGAKRGNYARIVGDDQPFEPELLLGFAKVILWGANHYAARLPPSKGWLVWNKRDQGRPGMHSDAELAWTNVLNVTRCHNQYWQGAYRLHESGEFYHPSQKPVLLMRWCIELAGEAQTILDPFMGSGTTLRAAKDLGRKAIGIEIEERYCEIAAKRMSQGVLL